MIHVKEMEKVLQHDSCWFALLRRILRVIEWSRWWNIRRKWKKSYSTTHDDLLWILRVINWSSWAQSLTARLMLIAAGALRLPLNTSFFACNTIFQFYFFACNIIFQFYQFLLFHRFISKENLEFVKSETLWCVADPDHAAPLHLGAVLLVAVQLDLQLEGPGTVRAPFPEKNKNQSFSADAHTWGERPLEERHLPPLQWSQ